MLRLDLGRIGKRDQDGRVLAGNRGAAGQDGALERGCLREVRAAGTKVLGSEYVQLPERLGSFNWVMICEENRVCEIPRPLLYLIPDGIVEFILDLRIHSLTHEFNGLTREDAVLAIDP